MSNAELERKFNCHAFFVKTGVVALVPKEGTMEELKARSKDERPVAVMFLYFENMEAYERYKRS